MKKIHVFFVSIIFALFALPVFAQVSVDPSDSFYTDALRWELKGVAGPLPQVRPYPMKVVKRILSQVLENEATEESDLVQAQEYYERFFGEHWLHVAMNVGGRTKTSFIESPVWEETTQTDEDGNEKTVFTESGEIDKESEFQKQVYVAPSIIGDALFLGDWASVGIDVGLFATSIYDDTTLLSYGTNSDFDSVTDASSVGPLDMFLDANLNGAAGTDKIYLQGGLSRVGFGYFYGDEIALNSTAFHAANMIYNIDTDNLSYSHVVESVGATNNIGEDLYSGKLVAFQSLKYQLFPDFWVGFYEASVFEKRFEPGYMFPSLFMAVQGLNGTSDNVWMGLFFESRARKGVKLVGDFFIDDLSANDLMKLKFNTKIRMAAQGGLLYAPSESIMKMMSLSAMFVAPYAYTHWELSDDDESIESTTVNYQSYTNNNICIGASIPPNSLKFQMSMNFEPVSHLSIDFITSVIMHGNVNESLSDEEKAYYTMDNIGYYDTTGGVNNHSKANASAGWGERGYLPSAWNTSMFMDQEHLKTTLQTGLSATYSIPSASKRHRVIFKAGYTLEYVHNEGVENQMFTSSSSSLFSYDSENKVYLYAGNTYEEFEEAYNAALSDNADYTAVIDSQYEEWLSRLHDCVNHYFSLSVKFVY